MVCDIVLWIYYFSNSYTPKINAIKHNKGIDSYCLLSELLFLFLDISGRVSTLNLDPISKPEMSQKRISFEMGLYESRHVSSFMSDIRCRSI